MTIREDFEKAYNQLPLGERKSFDVALWAAKWAMEKIAKEVEVLASRHSLIESDDIHQMIKELS